MCFEKHHNPIGESQDRGNGFKCGKQEVYRREESQDNRKRRAGVINALRNIGFWGERWRDKEEEEHIKNKSMLKTNV